MRKNTAHRNTPTCARWCAACAINATRRHDVYLHVMQSYRLPTKPSLCGLAARRASPVKRLWPYQDTERQGLYRALGALRRGSTHDARQAQHENAHPAMRGAFSNPCTWHRCVLSREPRASDYPPAAHPTEPRRLARTHDCLERCGNRQGGIMIHMLIVLLLRLLGRRKA